jgi:parallel beta-helix repeat protein
MFVLPLPYVVTAQSLGVFADGNDHSATLAAGISALPAGSSIYFSAGTYVLNHFTISNSVRLYGDGKSSTILSQGDASQTNFITLAANNVVFEKMTIQATGTTTNGVNIPTGTTDITFDRVKVTGAQAQGVNAFSATRLHVFKSEFSGNGNTQFYYTLETGQTCSDLVLEDSLFDSTGMTAPWMCAAIGGQTGACSLTDVKITGNIFKTFTRPTAETDCLVLSVAGSNANTLDRVVIANNSMQSTSAATTSSCYGIEIAGKINAVVTGNRIEACSVGIITENSPTSGGTPNNVVIANNLILPNTAQSGGYGIYAAQGASVSIIGNVLPSPGVASYGIITSCSSAIIEGNWVYGNGVGIRVSSSNTVAQGNIVQGGTYLISLQGTISNVQVRNNYMYGGNIGIWPSGTFSGVQLSGNTFSSMTTTYYAGLTTTAGITVVDDSVAGSTSQNVPAILGTYTVSALPAASTALKGALAVVTDAASPTWGSALTGSGSTVCLALCQGTGGWVAA